MIITLKKQRFTGLLLSLSLSVSLSLSAAATTTQVNENQNSNTIANLEQQTDLVQQTNFNDSFNRFMHHLNTELEINSGTAISVVKNDKILYQQNFGYADIKKKQAVTNNTLFYIASTTKPLFALALMQELQKNNQGLESTLAELFPNIAFANGSAVSSTTVKQLLNHTSGLEGNGLTAALALSGQYNQKTLLEFLTQLTKITKVPANNDANVGTFDYSNLGYNILSLAFNNNNNFQKSWQSALIDNVFHPLAMTHSSPFYSYAKKQHWQISKPYSFFSESIESPLYLEKSDNVMHAAGGVISTANDMANLLLVQLNKGKLNGKQVLSADLIKLSQQVTADVDSKKGDFKRTGYALGWYVGEYKSEELYHHFARFAGFRPHVSFIPKRKIGLVILNNEGDLNDKVTDIIADFAYSTLLGETGVEARLKKRIAKLKVMASKYRKKVLTKETAYKSMPWKLNLPNNAYLGHYKNKLMGNININKTDNHSFQLDWGNMKSLATATESADIIRIRFLPSQPQKISFNVVNNAVQSLTYDDVVFTKLTHDKK
ncbi:MAG: beta-lactamase family protein [Alteromonadaceae bacterium]|nr:beta-lactamase family protein [Alteromonadaceae bacterium]